MRAVNLKINEMNYTLALGNTTELECAAAFSNLGYVCLFPYGGGERFDFVVYSNNQFYKIQCKSSRWTSETKRSFTFYCKTSNENSVRVKTIKYDKTQIDYFATYFEGKVYVIPVEKCTNSTKTLRLDSSTGKTYKFEYAEDYIIDKYFPKVKLTNETRTHFYLWKPTKYICIDCGAPVKIKGGRCRSCANKIVRKNRHIPDDSNKERELLKNYIRKYPFLQVAKLLNITDSGVRIRCKRLGLPYQKHIIKNMTDEELEQI